MDLHLENDMKVATTSITATRKSDVFQKCVVREKMAKSLLRPAKQKQQTNKQKMPFPVLH